MRDDSGKMAQRCRLSEVAIFWRLDRRENSRVRRTRPGRPFPSGNTSRKGTVAMELENCFYQEGVQAPIGQQPDFREAKRAYCRPYKEHVESTGQGSTITRFTLELAGDVILQQVRLHPRSGIGTMKGSRIKVGFIGDLQPGLNSNFLRSKSAQGNLWHFSKHEVIPTRFFTCSGRCF